MLVQNMLRKGKYHSSAIQLYLKRLTVLWDVKCKLEFYAAAKYFF